MSYTTINFQWNKSTERMLAELDIEAGGKVQRVIDKAVTEYSIPYCPWDEGALATSPRTASSPGQVVYPGPYARYLYYGEVYGPNFLVIKNGDIIGWRSKKGERKHPTGRSLKFQGAPKRGAFWFVRMKADRLKDIVQEAQNAVRK